MVNSLPLLVDVVSTHGASPVVLGKSQQITKTTIVKFFYSLGLFFSKYN
jgi:hypothetical protein